MRRAFLALLAACGVETPIAQPAGDAAVVLEPPDASPFERDLGVVPAVRSLSIRPTTVRLRSAEGERVEQVFEAYEHLADGTTRAAAAEFSLEPLAIGEIGPTNGLFRANGRIGGAARVKATALDPGGGRFEATASLEVHLERSVFGPGVPRDAPGRFAAPRNDPARAIEVLYPLDGAVMPQNVFPADVQWERGDENDLFRVRLEKPHAAVFGYLRHDGPSFAFRWTVEADAWRALAESDPAEPATITVERLVAATGDLIAGARPVRVRFARAALTGSVYYWDIAAGRIRRIDDGTNTPVSFMPSPPVAADGHRCVGCHAVSASGRYMAGRLGGGENIGAIFDLTTDLSGDPPPTTFPLVTTPPTSLRWWFSSWSPDDRRIVVSTDEGRTRGLAFYDPFAGTPIVVQGALPTNATHPAWSPDGTRIAYVSGIDSWGGAFTAGDLSILPIAGDVVGTSTVIHRGADLAASAPRGVADSYPTWTPDSRRIAFAHGDGCRSETHRAALYAIRADGTDLVRLNKASGGAIADDNFQPRFAPFDQGGYFWLSFLSRRDYGNAIAGTKGSDFQQVWIAAIKKDPAPGEDPSEVAYWLPGQDTKSRNISAYWAPRACRPDGESCAVGSECCSADCRPNAGDVWVCSPPPPDRCRPLNQTCSASSQCCDRLSCVDRVCAYPPL